MIIEKLAQAERMIQEVKITQDKIQNLINERKLMFADMGMNQAIKALSELIILELTMDSINESIVIDDDGIEVDTGDLKRQVPGSSEIFGYISTEYRNSLSDECTTLKKFVDQIQHQEITDTLF